MAWTLSVCQHLRKSHDSSSERDRHLCNLCSHVQVRDPHQRKLSSQDQALDQCLHSQATFHPATEAAVLVTLRASGEEATQS